MSLHRGISFKILLLFLVIVIKQVESQRGWQRRTVTTATRTSNPTRLSSSRINPLLVSSHRRHGHHQENKTFEKKRITDSRNMRSISYGKHPPVVAQQTVATPILSIPQRLLAGGCSRGVAQMVLYPMDALRTLAQTRDGRTLADVGTKALIRGCATTSSFAVLIGSIQFAIFGATRDTCGPALSAALGAAGSCLVSVPQEVIKQRLVTGVYDSFRNAVTTIYNTEGVRGFYSAWRPTVARNIPFVVVTFTAMDYLRQYRLDSKTRHYYGNNEDGENDDYRNAHRKQLSLTVVENLIIGISSSLIGATLTHPADVIKTRMMTQAASKALPYSSTMNCIQTIWKTEGIKSFYSGFAQRSAYMGPLWALQFALNGKITAAFKDQNLRMIRQ